MSHKAERQRKRKLKRDAAIALFLQEYKALCLKHGLYIVGCCETSVNELGDMAVRDNTTADKAMTEIINWYNH